MNYSGKLVFASAPSPWQLGRGRGLRGEQGSAPALGSAGRREASAERQRVLGRGRETSAPVGDSPLAKSRRLKQEERKCYVVRGVKSRL